MAIAIDAYLQTFILGNTILQYLVFLIYILASIALGKLTYYFFKTIVRSITSKTKTTIDDIIVEVIEFPIILFVVSVGFYFAYKTLILPENVDTIFSLITKNLLTVVGAWFLIRLIDKLIENYLTPLALKSKSDLDDHLVPIVRQVVKIALIAIVIVMIMHNFGYDVTSLVAGLGIGGLAFALAAQEILKNFFGGMTILGDKPFKMGDWIEIDKYSGTVVEIGMRSTRLKTAAGDFVTIPNGMITSNAVLNALTFPTKKVSFTLGLDYRINADKIEKAKILLRQILESLDIVNKETIEVFFIRFNSYSQDIDVVFEVKTNKGAEIKKLKDAINIKIKRAFEKEKLEMAFPTQTVYMNK
jgi:MscS family membrane protein